MAHNISFTCLKTNFVQPTQTHVSWSRAFKEKVINNPHFYTDFRNITLVATTDGVPLFDDQHRGMWPFILRTANLPDSLSMRSYPVSILLIYFNIGRKPVN